jgi:uncharacterized repeat protein (TIGR03803 family)
MALLALILAAGPVRAQNYKVLYSFTGGADGGEVLAGVISDGAGNLYGTTESGGIFTGSCAPQGCGVVFKLDSSGKETVLYRFTGGADGAFPTGALVRDAAGNLYGTTASGGTCSWIYNAMGCGLVFKLDPATGHETVLYSFTGGADGAGPEAGLFLDNAGILYGTATLGGGDASGRCQAIGCGVVFRLDPSTSTYTVLYSFTGAADGGQPVAGLVQDSAGNLYGTTSSGGLNVSVCGGFGCGVVFKLDPSGTYTVLYTFTGQADGGTPVAALIRDADGNLYGTTENGGDFGWGVVFKLDPSGNETVLHEFTGAADGATLRGGVIQDAAGNLYGATMQGGSGSFFTNGVIFEIDSSGTYVVLHTLAANAAEGMWTYAGLVMDSAGNLYGTTSGAGPSCTINFVYCGVVFELTPGVATNFNISTIVNGNGSVESTPAGIDCGSTCSANFANGTSVTLTPVPLAGFTFVGWTGGCSGTGSCTLASGAVVTAGFSSVGADFTLTPASTTLAIQPGGQGTDVVTIAPQNGLFESGIQLSCTVAGPTPMPACALSPSSVTLPGENSATTTLTITAPTRTAAQLQNRSSSFQRSFFALGIPLLFGISVIGKSRRRNSRVLTLSGLLLMLIILQIGCSSSLNRGGTGTPTNYTVTVTASSGSIQHMTQVTITVQ